MTEAMGRAALYLIGTAWFMIQTKNSLAASMGMCVIPFLPGDAVKVVADATGAELDGWTLDMLRILENDVLQEQNEKNERQRRENDRCRH